MKRPSGTNPPVLPWWLEPALYVLAGPKHYQNVAGDLCEEYCESISPRPDFLSPNRWFRQQLLSFVSPAQCGCLLGALCSVSILVRNVLLPALHLNLPDDGPVETLFTAIFVSVTVILWGWAGAVYGRSAGFAQSIRAGALISFIQMLIVTLTFVAVNNLFLSIVSKQPGKIWGLAQSGLPSMRSYVNHAAMRGLLLVPPIALAIGATAATFGCLIGRVRRITS